MAPKRCTQCGTVWTFREFKTCVFCGGAAVDEDALPRSTAARPAAAPARTANGAAAAKAPVASRPPAPEATEAPQTPRPPAPPARPIPSPPPPPEAPQSAVAAPALPSTRLPFALGLSAILACGLLPLAAHERIYAVLGLAGLAAGLVLALVAPLAWIAGVSSESRFRRMRVLPPASARAATAMGLLGTILVVFQVAALTVAVAASRMSGRPSLPF
jgi:hypothetical protein